MARRTLTSLTRREAAATTTKAKAADEGDGGSIYILGRQNFLGRLLSALGPSPTNESETDESRPNELQGDGLLEDASGGV